MTSCLGDVEGGFGVEIRDLSDVLRDAFSVWSNRLLFQREK